MKKILSLLVLLILLFTVLKANEGCHKKTQNRLYLALTTAAITPFSVETTSPTLVPAETESCWGVGLGAIMGYEVSRWRLEGEILYGKSKANNIIIDSPDYPGGKLSGYYDMWSVAVNLYYDIANCTKLSPYVGAGAGLLQFSSVDVVLGDDPPTYGCNNIFSYNLMAGCTYPLSPAWHLLIGYRFTGTGKQNFKTGPDILKAEPVKIHSLKTGVRYYF